MMMLRRAVVVRASCGSTCVFQQEAVLLNICEQFISITVTRLNELQMFVDWSVLVTEIVGNVVKNTFRV